MASPSNRESFVYTAKLAEQAERYDEMVESMKKVACLNVKLTVEERNLLFVGYKNAVGARRASWKTLCSLEQKEEEEAKGNELLQTDHNVSRIREYRQKVEGELSTICTDVVTVINDHLLPYSSSGEGMNVSSSSSSVFYHRMKGDHYRYLAEFKTGNDKKEAADLSLRAYETATAAAESADLAPTHPIRLGLALNFSLFFYEIVNSPERACHLAKQAFDDALRELDTLSEESYDHTAFIMQMLRDNLTLWWTDDIPEDGAHR